MASEAEQRRKARLAAELRENLKRRKTQGRVRAAGDPPESAGDPPEKVDRAERPDPEVPDESGA